MSIEAFLRGKLPELRNREDYLTSCVFETFKYLPSKWIIKFLNQCGASVGKNRNLSNDFDKIEYYFWPNFALSQYHDSLDTQPDVIIVVDHIAVIVEAKFYASKSGVGVLEETIEDKHLNLIKTRKQILDQLAREYLIGECLVANRFFNIIPTRIKNFFVLYLTLDPIRPNDDFDDTVKTLQQMPDFRSLDNVESKLLWANWHDVSVIMHSAQSTDNNIEYLIASNLCKFFNILNLLPFEGFTFIDEIILNFSNIDIEYIYYKPKLDVYYAFIKDIHYDYTVKNDIFYKKVFMPYWKNIPSFEPPKYLNSYNKQYNDKYFKFIINNST